MAILTQAENQIEVKIIRRPDNTYFDEHVDTEEPDIPDATGYVRYLVGEPGQNFGIEVKLKKGYNFGRAVGVEASFALWSEESTPVSEAFIPRPVDYEGAIKEDITVILETSNATVGISGKNIISGGRFVMNDLKKDRTLKNTTDVPGPDPHNVNGFCVIVRQVTSVVNDSIEEYETRVREALKEKKTGMIQKPHWGVKKVDQESYHSGITFAINVVGYNWTQLDELPQENYLIDRYTQLEFLFLCHEAGFLKRSNILNKPLPQPPQAPHTVLTPPPSPRKEPALRIDDNELEKKEMMKRKLDEDIAELETLIKMKRRRDALQGEIDAKRELKARKLT